MAVAQSSKWDSGLYDEKHSFVWKMAGDVIELLAPKPGQEILDVGCGTGHMTAQIAASGAKVMGVDLSASMVQRAREKYPEIMFAVADACELSLEKKFDAVLSNATLHWIKEPQRAAQAVASRLKVGGRFVGEFGGAGNISGFMEAATSAWHTVVPGQQFPNPWFYPGIAEYASILAASGLETTYAVLFDRPTPLEDGERGLRNWIAMFAQSILEKLPAEKREEWIDILESQARGKLFRDGRWVLDYRRLRFVAHKV
jgi:trans-aconitate methyltransferase